MGSESRKRNRHIMVRVSDEEHALIAQRAREFGYVDKRAALLRDLALGVEPKSTIDQQAVLSLIQVAADQGRLGGLLKHWLQAKGADKRTAVDIQALLRDIEHTQAELKAKVQAL